MLRDSDKVRISQAASLSSASIAVLCIKVPALKAVYDEGLLVGKVAGILMFYDALERAGFDPAALRVALQDTPGPGDVVSILTNPPPVTTDGFPKGWGSDLFPGGIQEPRPKVEATTDVERGTPSGDEPPGRNAYGNDGTDGTDVIAEPVGIPEGRPGWNVPPIDCTPDNLCDVCRETGLAGGNHV